MAAPRPVLERRHPPTALMKVVNPVVRRLVARGKAGDVLLLLHFTGRKSGHPFDLPAGYHLVDDRITVFTNSGWRHNFVGGRNIHVTLHGTRRPAHAVLVAEPDEVTTVYQSLITQLGPAKAQRRLGIRINVDRVPSYDEIREAITVSGLSMIRITP